MSKRERELWLAEELNLLWFSLQNKKFIPERELSTRAPTSIAETFASIGKQGVPIHADHVSHCEGSRLTERTGFNSQVFFVRVPATFLQLAATLTTVWVF
jgi:hypothetical protein